ncbi:carbohydrate ABC transporter permease [Cellulomonas sp. PhB143]|uniref:carbohydrate ABC transporter permease n=1 Tax=Cellulomonas sp. PhB143 TaxID=2485186 RepID=UPI000F47EE54|nr:carbohydrate ABC transporter permease [Cellulomonas sp. PhB143]ROS78937.1 carbohydrate ABC transporter membrane protein 2 (CUT1 family) [Cellulomonas sp. PhB143]
MGRAGTVRKSFAALLGVVWLVPVYLIVVNAAKDRATYNQTSAWIPAGISGLWENLGIAWTSGHLAQSVSATAVYAIVAPALAVVIGAMAGYGIVALRLKHGFFWLIVIFASTVFPLQMLLMPLFIGYVDLNIYDTKFGLILVYTVMALAFSAFVMRNFFTGVAREMFEAAVVDGASAMRIFWRIYLPLATPALTAIFILQATGVWNDLLLGLTLSRSQEVRPLMASVASLQGVYGGTTMPVLLAAGLIVSVPTILLFLLTQRAFGRGLALGQF